MEDGGGARVTRRALLGVAAAAGLAAAGGCSSGPGKPAAPPPPDPQTVLIGELIADKERLVSLYGRAVAALPGQAAALEPFRQRHAAHARALRALLPAGNAPTTPAPSSTGSAVASPSGSPSDGSPEVSVGALRDAERTAAAARPAQTATASPALAQLLASIGACEAVHVVALGRLRG
ncbi:hypothetical protein [Microbispora triticiradicis]|uniref:hypothetical protein n=1 Tax=Microbispora triticiradicis TaxID=2200763 RepID=UPI001AD7885D|nr:hypothetical protein [Microbispora triticiradicis]MBO4273818.1 hypothetical protein [Microbispora triticiradicis]